MELNTYTDRGLFCFPHEAIHCDPFMHTDVKILARNSTGQEFQPYFDFCLENVYW